MNFFDLLKVSRKKRYLFYFSSVTFFFILIFIFVHIKMSSIEASVYVTPVTPFSSQQLIDDIASRLNHLQHRVTGSAFYIHKIKMRENLWKIAVKKRYSVHSIIGCNPQLKTYDVSINQKILIPSKSSILSEFFTSPLFKIFNLNFSHAFMVICDWW